MKKSILLLSITSIASAAQAQFLDDFESYTVGAYLAATSPDWDTWDGAPSGSDDVQITDADAHSGTNSIYFSTTDPMGGPQDVVLPFGGEYTTGNFHFELWMKVEANKGAYFNFQSNTTPGQVWAFETFFGSDGSVLVVSDTADVIQGSYTPDTWINVSWDIDLDLNSWELLIDGTSLGTFSNTNNRVASLDLFPVSADTLSGFFIDDVAYAYDPDTGTAVIEPESFQLLSSNPASDVLTLQLPDYEFARIVITDMAGRVIHNEQLNGASPVVTIPVSHFATGVYLVSVTEGSSLGTRKLLIE